MTSLAPISYQCRSFDNLFVFKPQNDQLVLKVYDLGQKCIFKKTIFLDELNSSPKNENNNSQTVPALKLPDGIQNASMLLEAFQSDLSLLLKLVDLKELQQEQNYAAPSLKSCEEAVSQAIQQFKPKVSIDCEELKELECPITHEVFKEPVMDEHGHTFEKSAIEQHRRSPNAVCPMNRQPINSLAPNLQLKALIEKYQQKEPIPCFSLFRKDNQELAQKNLEMAQQFITHEEYDEALASFSSAFQYTKNWHHYKNLPDLFIKMKEPEKTLLAYLYLALYQIRDSKIPEAIKTLEGCQKEEFRQIDILLIQLYQLNNEHPKALQLARESAQELRADQTRKTIALYKQILAGDPDQFDLYEPLANLLESPKEKIHILLKGACHALEIKDLAAATHLSTAASEDYFLDQLVSLNLIQMQQPPSVLRQRVRILAEKYKQMKQLEQALKAYKTLFQLNPSLETFQQIESTYQTLGKQGRINKWRVSWMCQLSGELKDTKAQLHEARMQLGLDKEIRISQKSHRQRIPEIAFENDKTAAQWYSKAAKRGHAEAQCCLGVCYASGRGVANDEATAAKWFLKAAEQGHAQAQFNLGVCYANGKGVPKNDKIAAKWYSKAAQQGHAQAQNSLSICYANGKGVPKNDKIAAEWYAKAAEQGHAQAQNSLGIRYESGKGVDKNDKIAFEWYSKAAQQEHADAQFNLGYCYANGRGVAKNAATAVEWYRKAVAQGFARAQCNLGLCYYNGEGVAKNEATAADLYSKAAEQGHAEAQCHLGVCYANGEGVPPYNYETAAKLFSKAAEQGHAEAQCHLGYYYVTGSGGVPQNNATAVEWYRKAIAQGFARAQFQLGECYANGTGVPQNEATAAEWYLKAAEQGDVEAQYKLGVCYANGRGVTKNDENAFGWYSKAAEQGYVYAINMLKYYLKTATQGYTTKAQFTIGDTTKAQFTIGVCYANGRGVTQNNKTAAQWFSKAAQQGHASAQTFLGDCYANGKGVAKNDKTAAEWYSKAAQQGDAKAIKLLKKLKQ